MTMPLPETHKSISQKLMFINVTTILLALFFGFSIVIINEFIENRKDIANDLIIQAKIIANNSTAALTFSDKSTAAEILSALQYSKDVQHAVIRDSSDSLFAEYIRPNNQLINNSRVTPGNEPVVYTFRTITVTQPILFQSNIIGTLVIEANLERIYEHILSYTLIIFVIILISSLIASFVLSKLNHNVIHPLLELTQTIKSITSKKDFSLRSKITTNDEIGTMADCFNGMLSEIQVRDTELRRELNNRKKAEERLDKLAHYDTVTDLPNRHYFNVYFPEIIEKAEKGNIKVALIFIDLDNFKIINDTLGHYIGDILLKSVAMRISEKLRPNDTICRVGGDEFAIIIDQFSTAIDLNIIIK